MDSNSNSEIPEMNLDNKYSTKLPEMQNNSQAMKEFEKTRKDFEKLKGYILKKYPFTMAIGLLTQQSIKLFIEDEDVPKETEKFLHLYVIIPEEEFQKKNKDGSRPYEDMKKDIIKQTETLKEKVWVQIKTPVDIWENCLDSRFDLTSAIAMAFPIHDTGFLGLLRMVEIHKSLVLQKFEKYVVSYVVVGSFIRGEATETSDADIAIIINDTDVKIMPRLELKERIRNIIYQYVAEAAAIAGVKNNLHVQSYLLTEFWESVKDAHPVMFTFIRDGVPIYDIGTFLPWKALLRMGKLKPSAEAIDVFMKSGEKTKEMVDRRLLDAMIDVYYGVLNPSQALVMLYGSPPPTHKETPRIMEEIFVKDEKMLTKKDVEILYKIVKMFKEYEHDLKFVVSGKEVDELVKEYDNYMNKLKGLRKKIEKRTQEKTLEQLHKEVFELLKVITKKDSETAMITGFKALVSEGKFQQNDLKILKDLVSAKTEFKKGKIEAAHKMDEIRKNSMILINDLIDYTQRCDLAGFEKTRLLLKYEQSKTAELINADGFSFLLKENKIFKLKTKIENSDMNELAQALEKQKNKKKVEIDSNVFSLLKKELGDYEIVM